MKLRDITFEPCWDASGVRGWAGEGYWFHILPLIYRWYDLSGSTRVGKTTTMWRNGGNMPLRDASHRYEPEEGFPECIWWNFFGNRTLNAVGLAGPGASALDEANLLYPEQKEPYMVSFMAIRPTLKERLAEFAQFVALSNSILQHSRMRGRVALQLNLSCPNTGHDTRELLEEANKLLDISAQLKMPKVVKVNILPPPEAIAEIAKHPECDALCFTNALPFGSQSAMGYIEWQKLFPKGSPLKNRNERFGGGGYSGTELLPMVCNYSFYLRKLGVEKPINLGGGIRSAEDVEYAVDHAGLRRGKDSIFFASAAIVRPWNIRSIIRRAHELLG